MGSQKKNIFVDRGNKTGKDVFYNKADKIPEEFISSFTKLT
jgi:hypothetical protein